MFCGVGCWSTSRSLGVDGRGLWGKDLLAPFARRHNNKATTMMEVMIIKLTHTTSTGIITVVIVVLLPISVTFAVTGTVDIILFRSRCVQNPPVKPAIHRA